MSANQTSSAMAALTPQEINARREESQKKLMAALEEYAAWCPKKPEPDSPPNIEPRLMHVAPNNFHLGYNMLLDAGGYMPGKIPVLVIPMRIQDVKQYSRKCTINGLKAALGFGLLH